MPDLIKLESSGDMQQVVDDLMKKMLTAYDKSKIQSSTAANAYMDQLLEIKNESLKSIQDCKAVDTLHISASKETDIDKFVTSTWPECIAKFKPVHTFIAAGVKKHKEVPPISDELKKSTPPESLQIIQNAYDTTVKFRNTAEQYFKRTLKNHNSLNGIIKKQIEMKQQQQGAGGVVHPAPSQPVRPSQPILSSSFEAKQHSSALQSQSANANRTGVPPVNQQGQKK